MAVVQPIGIVQKIALKAGYSVPAPGIQQILQATGSVMDMSLAKNNNWFDTALNIAGIASLFYAPLLLPVAIGYGIKSLTYLAGAVKSLFSFDFGGVFSNAGAAGLNLLGALPIFGKVACQALKGAWTTALEQAGGKFTGQFAQQFGDDLVRLLAGENTQILTSYRAGVNAFKNAGKLTPLAGGAGTLVNETAKDVSFLKKLWLGIKEYFSTAGSVTRTAEGGFGTRFVDRFTSAKAA